MLDIVLDPENSIIGKNPCFQEAYILMGGDRPKEIKLYSILGNYVVRGK